MIFDFLFKLKKKTSKILKRYNDDLIEFNSLNYVVKNMSSTKHTLLLFNLYFCYWTIFMLNSTKKTIHFSDRYPNLKKKQQFKELKIKIFVMTFCKIDQIL